jgi:hypothetical protein
LNAQRTNDAVCETRAASSGSNTNDQCAVAHIDPGDFLEYTIQSDQETTAEITIRVASFSPNRVIRIELDNRVTKNFMAPGEGWSDYRDLVWKNAPIKAGLDRIFIHFPDGNVNFCALSVEIQPGGDDDNGPVFRVPFTAGALEYSMAKSLTPGNIGDSECGDGPVDAQLTEDEVCIASGALCNIGWTNSGDYLEYTFLSDYERIKITARVASKSKDNALSLEVFDDDTSHGAGTFNTAPGLGWQNFVDFSMVHARPKVGTETTLRVTFETGRMNLCSITIEPISTEPVPFPIPASIGALDYAYFIEKGTEEYGNCGVDGEVDAQLTSDPVCIERGADCNIGWTEPGEWVRYLFTSEESVTADVTIRVASFFPDKEIFFSVGSPAGSAIGRGGIYNSPGEGWQEFEDIVLEDVLFYGGTTSGVDVEFLTGGVNLCSITISNVKPE